MPTYEYRCRECGHELEIYQSFTDEPLSECPVCSGPLRKLFGNVGISFKGSGFYKNDHGSRSKKSDGRTESATKTSSSDASSSNGGSSSSEGSKAEKAAPPAPAAAS